MAVLLSTFNGSRYLEEQLSSLSEQSYDDFTIYIRDDGSIDNTLEIINDFISRERNVVFIESNDNLGAAGSFIYLINNVDADYYFFCDQDDVWMPDKIAVTMQEMKKYSQDEPVLIHTDLMVVDSDLSTISDSFYKYSNISRDDFIEKKQLLIQNYIVGCTCCINKNLAVVARVSLNDVNKIAMHDWWFALHARFFGKIIYINRPTIKYRQHQNNTLGAQKDSMFRYVKMLKNNIGVKRVNKFREKIMVQSIFFEKRNNNKLSSKEKGYFNDLALLGKGHGFYDVLKFFFIKKNSMKSVKRNLAFIFSSFFYNK
ncbi:glycosyltransferase family 2 protein [Citrobacter portucalensis]|uniref:glycosyltransferase family 2 protein n=1 Tax=Citrobacter portucalensis TaxID=1639133 RepID=UPI0018A97043|nr:glycosyltransferase family 2 protein [Citrobacter portucalensis]UKK90263.1 glycosyltransferase family 2 protein [Citrobacter portucalensis]